MLIEYYFKIQYTKGSDNTRVDALSRKAELQNDEKLLGALLRKDSNRLIRYNYPKILGTHKVLESVQAQRIQEVQLKDLKLEQYEY